MVLLKTVCTGNEKPDVLDVNELDVRVLDIQNNVHEHSSECINCDRDSPFFHGAHEEL